MFTYVTNICLTIIQSNKLIHSTNMSTPYLPHRLRYCLLNLTNKFILLSNTQNSLLKNKNCQSIVIHLSQHFLRYIYILYEVFRWYFAHHLKTS